MVGGCILYNGYVYQITNEVTGELYIGQTTNHTRFESHVMSVIKGKKNKLYNNMREYGLKNFNFKYLAWIELEDEELVWLEMDRLELKHWRESPTDKCLNTKQPSPCRNQRRSFKMRTGASYVSATKYY